MHYLIEIASVPDKEKLVAEIWLDGKLIAEISQEEKITVEFFCGKNGVLSVDYNLLVEALHHGLKKLLGE